jgi:hypothetical protein
MDTGGWGFFKGYPRFQNFARGHNKKRRIPHPKRIRGSSLPPALCKFWEDKGAVFSKVVLGFQNFAYYF